MNKLHSLLDLIESHGPARSSVSVHFVNDRETLAGFVRVLDEPKVGNECGASWVTGKCDGVEVTVFYNRQIENADDQLQCGVELSRLLAEFAPACASVDL